MNTDTVQQGDLRSDRGLPSSHIHDTFKAGKMIILRLPQARLPHQQ